jgi:hypothetical protein
VIKATGGKADAVAAIALISAKLWLCMKSIGPIRLQPLAPDIDRIGQDRPEAGSPFPPIRAAWLTAFRLKARRDERKTERRWKEDT